MIFESDIKEQVEILEKEKGETTVELTGLMKSSSMHFTHTHTHTQSYNRTIKQKFTLEFRLSQKCNCFISGGVGRGKYKRRQLQLPIPGLHADSLIGRLREKVLFCVRSPLFLLHPRSSKCFSQFF
jgi:hypothetical protein